MTFETTKNKVWYKFTIHKQSVVTLSMYDDLTYFDIYDASGNTVISHGEHSDKAMLNYYSVKKEQDTVKDDYIKYTFYKTGTYYLCTGKTAGYNGKIKVGIRDYSPIESVNFKIGKDIKITTAHLLSSGIKNGIIGVSPNNTDERIAYSTFDSNSFATSVVSGK